MLRESLCQFQVELEFYFCPSSVCPMTTPCSAIFRTQETTDTGTTRWTLCVGTVTVKVQEIFIEVMKNETFSHQTASKPPPPCILFIISSHQMASKLTKNLGPPTSTLHVANLPDDFTHAEVKVGAVVCSPLYQHAQLIPNICFDVFEYF